MIAKQGHKYSYEGREVLALASATKPEEWLVSVAPIDRTQPYPLGPAFDVMVDALKPLPMVYFHGQVPE